MKIAVMMIVKMSHFQRVMIHLKIMSHCQKKKKFNELLNKLKEKRLRHSESILNVEFDQDRLRVIKKKYKENEYGISPDSKGIVYWMFREVRVEDNWALLYAQKLALEMKLPFRVCFCLVPKYLDATLRHYEFLLEGLKEVENDLIKLNINFHLLLGEPSTVLPDFIQENKIGGLVCDFLPLKLRKEWNDVIVNKLSNDIAFYEIDAHSIIPCWKLGKFDVQKKAIQKNVRNAIEEDVPEYPPVIKHMYNTDLAFKKTNWISAMKFIEVDKEINVVKLKPGYRSGVHELEKFIDNDLQNYLKNRNDFTNEDLIILNPWYRFGMISIQRVILELYQSDACYENEKSIEAYVKDTLATYDLADNFCYYIDNYDNIDGAPEWAKETLEKHKTDEREYTYSLVELENAKTHDDLWNAAQLKLIKDGTMHSFLRTYWMKKLLEWTKDPKDALNWSIHLTNKYCIEGLDPTTYLACMQSICGVHDRSWEEKPIYGVVKSASEIRFPKKINVSSFTRNNSQNIQQLITSMEY